MENEREILKDSIEEHQKAIDRAERRLKELEEPVYSIGDRFINRDGEKRILVAIGERRCDSVMFSNLTDGHGHRIEVEDWYRITSQEMAIHLYRSWRQTYKRYWNSKEKKREEVVWT